jgi:hypothetical protein
MKIHELDISWAATTEERQHLRWELTASEEVRGVFLTAREDVLAVVYSGDRLAFESWTQSLEPDRTRQPVWHEAPQ